MDPQMDPQMEPLQCLPQQPLTSPKGARLVLCNDDAGYPRTTESSSSGMRIWCDNIAGTYTQTFLLAGTDTKTFLLPGDQGTMSLPQWRWRWPAVVLLPEEYSLRVGGMSVTGLRNQQIGRAHV